MGPVVHFQESRSLLTSSGRMDGGEAAGVLSGTGSGNWQLEHEYRVRVSQEEQGTRFKKGVSLQLSPHRK